MKRKTVLSFFRLEQKLFKRSKNGNLQTFEVHKSFAELTFRLPLYQNPDLFAWKWFDKPSVLRLRTNQRDRLWNIRRCHAS